MIIIDDFGSFDGARKAFYKFVSSRSLAPLVHKYDPERHLTQPHTHPADASPFCAPRAPFAFSASPLRTLQCSPAAVHPPLYCMHHVHPCSQSVAHVAHDIVQPCSPSACGSALLFWVCFRLYWIKGEEHSTDQHYDGLCYNPQFSRNPTKYEHTTQPSARNGLVLQAKTCANCNAPP